MEGKLKLWTCLVSMQGHTIVTQLRASSAEEVASEFVAARIIENTLGEAETPWSVGTPHRRAFGPEMNDEFVSTWDFNITAPDQPNIFIQFIETVDQGWELPDEDF